MIDVSCPYCGHSQNIDHDDGYGYEEDEIHNQECKKCNKTFAYFTNIIFSYDAFKADCLNGSPHQYQPNKCVPNCFTKMQCIVCGDERTPTDEEREVYNIPTFDEYVKQIPGNLK